MLEVRWIWKHWKTWDFVIAEDEDGCGVWVVYLGCLVIGWHYWGDDV